MITLLDYFPNASHDSEKYSIPLSSLGIVTPTLSNVYFGLLYKIFGYYCQELRISSLENNRCLLVGDIPLLSIRNTPTIEEYSAFILNPYLGFDVKLRVKLNFLLLTLNPFFRTSFASSEMTELITWNSTDALIYNYPNYFSDWDNISGKDILTYLLHIGLIFKNGKSFTIIYNTVPVNRFEDTELVTYTEYRFNITFKLSIPSQFTNFTAQEII